LPQADLLERGTDIQAHVLTVLSDHLALARGQAGIGTGFRNDLAVRSSLTGEPEQFGGDTAGRSGAFEELRSFIPAERVCGGGVSESRVGEEEEQMVLDNGSAKTASPLIESIRILLNRV